MELHEEHLSVGIQNKRVYLLKIELTLLGFDSFVEESQNNPASDVKLDTYDAITQQAVRDFQAQYNLSISGIVDKTTAAQLRISLKASNRFAVYGSVIHKPDKSFVEDVFIEVYDRDVPSLNRDVKLGEAKTNAAGRYHIYYQRDQFSDAEANTADLQVVLPNIQTQEQQSHESKVFYNASRVQQIDIDLSSQSHRALHEYVSIRKKVLPLIGDVQLNDLTDKDLIFLNGETDIPFEHLKFLKLDVTYKLKYEQYELDPSIFYGLFRQGHPTSLRSLLNEKPSRWLQALKDSIKQNIIAGYSDDILDEFINELKKIASEHAFKSEEGETPGLGELVATTSLSDAQQKRFVDFSLDFEGGEEFWEKLGEYDFDDKAVADFRFTLESSQIVYSNLPVLKALQERKTDKGWSHVRDLARLKRDEVSNIVNQHAANEWPSEFESVEEYAEEISHHLELAYPTIAIAQAFSDNPDFESGDLSTFVEANESFDLLHAPIQTYFNDGAVLDGVQNTEVLKNDLMNMQRALRIVPEHKRAEHVKSMVTEGYTSAFSVAKKNKSTFVSDMSPKMGESSASLTYENSIAKAEHTSSIFVSLNDYSDRIPVFLRTPPSPFGDSPTWTDFFGSLNGCACEHCRSMYSPAAYMLELLSFLGDAEETPSAISVLLSRRPALRHIKLNCANATTSMPYIDLVNEILEEAVAPFPSADTWFDYQTPDANDETRAEIEARLRARPEFEHAAAYELLEEAMHPWLLPFSLNNEKIKLFSQHLGLDFVDLYTLLSRSEDWTVQAYLQIANPEWVRLTTPSPGNEEVWGVANLTNLNSVPTFLKQSNLDYEDLQSLLNTSFLATDSTPIVTYNVGEDPCDISDDTISGLDDSVIDRIYRFLRLRLQIDWSIQNLDTVLTAFGHLDVTRQSLKDVVRIAQLADSYRLDVSKLTQLTFLDLSNLLHISEIELYKFSNLIGKDGETPLTIHDQLDIIESWHEFQTTGFEQQELSYILLGHDQVPAVFTPLAEDLEIFLRTLHGVIASSEAEDEQAAVIQNLSQYWSLAPDVTERLIAPAYEATAAIIEAQSTIETPDTEPAINDILSLMHVEVPEGSRNSWDGLSSVVAPEIKAIYDNVIWVLIRIDRVARLLNILHVNRQELDAIVKTQSQNKFLDLNLLRAPGSPLVHPHEVIYRTWMALVKAKQLQANLPVAENDLFDFITHDASDSESTINFVAEHTGWNRDVKTGENIDVIEPLVRNLEGLAPIDTIDPALFQKVSTYERINQAVSWLRRWRISADTLSLWASRDSANMDDLVVSLEDTGRARFANDEAWYKALTPIMDRLREKKRDALVAYILSRDARFKTPAEIYAHELIDIEMSSCMLTSRIKQANASIQLFVQRILMNLETESGLQGGDTVYWRRWEWMKNYRVWEANRKVFLYPENWIEPELRDNKSSFFKQLEDELLQDDINTETVERSFTHYLEKLNDVGRLDVRGLYREQVFNDSTLEKDVLHVFARTYSEPHIYYYMKRNLKTLEWTPWEKVDVNIEGNHLIPVVHNGQLILFWVTFIEGETSTEDPDDKLPIFKINLHWSDYKYSLWQSPKSGSLSHLLQFTIERPIGYNNYDIAANFIKDCSFGTTYEEEKLAIQFYYGIPLVSTVQHKRYEVAKFVFDDCRNSLRLDETQEIVRVRYVGISQEMKLTTTNTTLEVLSRVSSDDKFVDTLHDERLSNTELTVAEYEQLSGVGSSKADLEKKVTLLENFTSRETWTLFPHQVQQFTSENPFVFGLEGLTFIVSSFTVHERVGGPISIEERGTGDVRKYSKYYKFELFYHPYICKVIEEFRKEGFNGIYKPISHADIPVDRPKRNFLDRQYTDPSSPSPLEEYKPDVRPDALDSTGSYGSLSSLPKESISFNLVDTYSQYNWELFFHIPFLIATRLSQNKKFDQAQRWFHYIFDPREVSLHPKPAKYWRVKPFFELSLQPIETLTDLMHLIATENEKSLGQVQVWRDDPFNPHHIARLRNIAYMKNVVMKYLDNLIAWGDDLFKLDTMESINEATQIFILAAEILGERSVKVKKIDMPEFTYEDFTAEDGVLDALNNAWIDLESESGAELVEASSSSRREPIRLLPYFCIPSNDKFSSYWDTVADRLFKIRHCMNSEGDVRELPLYEAPIDPALLVRARAAGLDLRKVLSLTRDVSLPHYRYSYTYQKAIEFCNEVRSLGNALLSALEKQDAEKLALLRSKHETILISQTSLIKKKQIEEAKETLDSIINARRLTEERFDFYSSREYINDSENSSMSSLFSAHSSESLGQQVSLQASVAHFFPQIHAQALASGTTFGGQQIGDALSAVAQWHRLKAGEFSFAANRSSTIGNYQRRRDDWNLQSNLAQKELEQIAKQIVAAEIRLAIAEQDIINHEKQLEQAQEVNDYMSSKFTNHELYGWMSGQLSALHYQAYQLAIDLARKAERAGQHELGLTSTEFQFIGFEQWDSQKKGLLAGERLSQQLRSMDSAFHEKNKRELELIKHISLAMLDPIQLLRLKETGVCDIVLPEAIFNLDYPGHFNRRIKSVSLSIPCVTGPYTTVNCTMTLGSNKRRIRAETDDTTALLTSLASQSIAISGAQNDSGLFELNFRDERYLPFEGVGAVSTWKLELGGKWLNADSNLMDFSQFDYDTISDVIMHLRYTARDGGSTLDGVGTFRDNVRSSLEASLESMAIAERRAGLFATFSSRHDFSSTWHSFLHPVDDSATHSLIVDLNKNRFPYVFSKTGFSIVALHVFMQADGESIPDIEAVLKNEEGVERGRGALTKVDSPINDVHYTMIEPLGGEPGNYKLEFTRESLSSLLETLKDIVIVCKYRI